MELLNEILIERGCEPSVIISYVALVREVYSHACVNIKQMKISDERRSAFRTFLCFLFFFQLIALRFYYKVVMFNETN